MPVMAADNSSVMKRPGSANVQHPININTANVSELATLPRISTAIAGRIVAARCSRLFNGWSDLQARVKGIGEKTIAALQSSALAVVRQPSSFDPVADLPADMAALCLSFVGVRTLLGSAQHVSRAWQDAIDGGLPAVWHDASIADIGILGYPMVEEVIEKSRSRTRVLNVSVSVVPPRGLDMFRSLCDLRVLHISSNCRLRLFDSHLLSFPLLEDLQVSASSVEIALPTMRFLHTVRCNGAGEVSGLHNLSALTELDLHRVSVNADNPWPASLSEISIHAHTEAIRPRILKRISALPNLLSLSTDWRFSVFIPPFDQLSFLPGITTLQRLSVTLDHHYAARIALFKCLGSISSLRHLTLEGKFIKDKDLQCLSRLINLQHLTLRNIPSITSTCLHFLSSLPSLVTLCVQECDRIADYSAVSSCSGLTELDITYHEHTISVAEVQAISRLQQLNKLTLYVGLFADASSLSRIFTSLRALHELRITSCDSTQVFSASAYSGLPSLSSLRTLRIDAIIQDVAKLVDCLVQMPRLRRIEVVNADVKLGVADEMRLRDALPKLETLSIW